MSAVEYALTALVAGAVVVLAVAAREVARLARTAEMIYALLYYTKPAAEEAPQAVEGAVEAGVERQGQQAAAQAAEGAPQQGGDECVVDLARRYGCLPIADVKLRCNVGIMILRRLRREGKIMITNDGRVCPK
jgi:hypothetical protein